MDTQQEIEDAALSGMAKAALGLDPEVDLNQVRVDTANGVVRLQGVVDNYEVKRRAEEAVRRLPGVRGVDSALAVEGRVDIRDEELSNAIEQAFAADPSLDATDMGARVADGIAHIFGRVDSINQQETAMRLASEVEGVKGVFSELRMEREGPTDDVTYHNDVVQVLSQAEDLDATYINVSVEEAEVLLTGRVEHDRDYERAEDLAGSVPGVRRVVNRLQIQRP